MKQRHAVRLRKLYERHADLYQELMTLFHKKSMSEKDKSDINNVLGLHLTTQIALGKLIGEGT